MKEKNPVYQGTEKEFIDPFNLPLFGWFSRSGAKDMTFQEFVTTCEHGFDTGEIRLDTGERLSERDYAIYWAISMLCVAAKAQNKPTTFTLEKIYYDILMFCGEEVFNRVFGEVDE